MNRRQSRNENHRTPLHFALLMNRQEMIALLLEPGADPLSVDGSGQPVAFYKEGTTEEERAKIREELTHLSAMAAIVPSRLHASRRRKREARENLLHAAVTPRAEARTEKQTTEPKQPDVHPIFSGVESSAAQWQIARSGFWGGVLGGLLGGLLLGGIQWLLRGQ